jgi:L-lactate dehydrogenase complex protein LldF
VSIRGPIGAVLTPQLRGINQHPVDAQTASLPFASSLCGACFDACPVRIDIPDLLVHLRAKVVDHKRATRRLPTGEQVAMTGAALVLGGPGRLAAAQRLAGVAGRVLGRGGRLRRLPGPGWVGAWFGSRDLVAPPPESFRAWWRRTRREGTRR